MFWKDETDVLEVTSKNIGTQGVQELFFCDLKAPGGCSTRWTHKGNSFMCTGTLNLNLTLTLNLLESRIPVNVIIKFSVLVQTLMIVVPKCFTTILQINSFPSFSPF